jgi:hypothetical protein
MEAGDPGITSGTTFRTLERIPFRSSAQLILNVLMTYGTTRRNAQ